MLSTVTRFETRHRFSEEIQRDLEEKAYKGEALPEKVVVPRGVFEVLREELHGQGHSKFEIRLAIAEPLNRWVPLPALDFHGRGFFTVSVVPE